MTVLTPSIDDIKASIDAALETLHAPLRKINREIWSNPETAYQEHRAHETICAFLESQGCTVTRQAYGLDTSFEAISGSGGRLINFNAEYDALPGIGHACGHNLITTSSVAAFLALSAVLKKYGIPGRAQLLGTPAEENGGGKAKLIEAGAYKGVDISLMAHAGPKKLFPGVDSDGVAGVLLNARKEIHCTFTGKSAHAGGNPWEGINALDALVSAYNNVAVMRQQMQPDERVHVAFLETPTVANVIPARTKAYWQVRSPTLKGLNRLMGKVRNCIEAGALSSGCKVEIVEDQLYTDIKINETLCERYATHMARYGRHITPSHDKVLTGSSDIGNVSYLIPTLHTTFAITDQEGSFPHHPSFAAAAGTDTAHDESVIVGKSLAMIGWEMLADDSLFELAKKQWEIAVGE
ncbi:M20 family metallopeptidase [Aspergillus clavatus NRRL 1]|uniref:Peptidase M20 domain-containing protein 2 n=1 Tax=Aspergillus clavatus (strain ATCC 1007 / CBS 513.65 / DSM 816 / NCTC 3887 / NRRL 1 / QM 1276 / 107) TaxID=344612 RepID=A1CU48_ASPCL|nr:amidohydrolase, putative [Aspergillus clavatus NRRL 1]EAW06835.1 amidohydrolase, putative [Aspergillus clavatus NRRL 1]